MQPFCYHTSLLCFLVNNMTKTFLIAIETGYRGEVGCSQLGGAKKCAFHCLAELNVSGCG
jgi:hypothetical protein